MNIVMTRDALIERLRDRLKVAKSEDARMKKEHEGHEKKALDAFRVNLREALKWDYIKLKTSRYESRIMPEFPACPKSQAEAIDRELRSVMLDMRKSSYTIQPKTDLYNAVHWLPEAERPKSILCD